MKPTITLQIGARQEYGRFPLRLFRHKEDGTRLSHPDSETLLPADLKVGHFNDDAFNYPDIVLTERASSRFEKIGEHLFALLSQGDVGKQIVQAQQTHPHLRILLDVVAPELVHLPWELTRQGDIALAIDKTQTFVRWQPANTAVSSDTTSVLLRIMVVVANKDRDVAAANEVKKIRDVLKSASAFTDLVVVEANSYKTLRSEYQQCRPHIFHFIGHGSVTSDIPPKPCLRFDLFDGGSFCWTPAEIKEFLRTAGWAPRLAFLNACRTNGNANHMPRANHLERAWSIASAFQQSGVPAVLTMLADVNSKIAGEFAGAFYAELAKGELIDSALATARVETKGTMPYARDWALPTLSLSVLPEHILLPIADEKKLQEIDRCSSFRGVAPFVDRDEERRNFCSILPNKRNKRLVLVHGDSQVGKSWTTSRCMLAFAYRGHDLRFVDVVQSRNWLDLLFQICDGDERYRLSMVHKPLKQDAFREFKWGVWQRLQNVSSLRFADLNLHDEAPENLKKLIPQNLSPEFIINHKTEIFNSFIKALKNATQDNPLILVFDRFTNNEHIIDPKDMCGFIIPDLILPIADGYVESVEVVLVLSETELKKYQRTSEIGDIGFQELEGYYADVLLKDIGEEHFVALAKNYLENSNDSSISERCRKGKLSRYIQDFKDLHVKGKWRPNKLRQLELLIDSLLNGRGSP